jgi:O-antigen/teichoic acid export membrane protein
LFSRWILQFFGGAVEQGYFAFSDYFSGLVLVFGNSITPLLQREFSIVYGKFDIGRMNLLFETSLLTFISSIAMLSIAVLFTAESLTMFLGGVSYSKSILPTQIMLHYPIPYIANNILCTASYATGHTKMLRNIQSFIAILN